MINKKEISNNNLKIIKMEEMNWKQIDELDRKKTIFFLPIGPLEEHGPHLPVGTDLLIARDIATETIKTLNKKNPQMKHILLPAIPVGYCGFNIDFPGSISVDSKVIRNLIISVGSSLSNHGFKYLIICTHHMALSSIKGIYLGMKKVMKNHDIKICEPWSPFFYSNKIEKNEPKIDFDTSKEVHAGFRETSLMKYQYPYLVDESYKKLKSVYRDLKSPKIIGKTFKDLGLNDGYVGSPSRADADYGRWFFKEIVNIFVDSTIKLYEGKKLPDLPYNIKVTMKLLFWQ